MFSIPDSPSAFNDHQSILFAEYLRIMVAGIDGLDCVLSGCAVTAQGTPDMTLAVAKGSVLTNGVLKAVAAANVTITTADATNPRFDLVVIDSAGAKQVRAGTPAALPLPPTRTANDVVLAAVYVPASDTTIESDHVTDLAVFRRQGSMVIYKTTAAETTNTTVAAVHVLNKTASGLVLPNGLFLSGKQLRCRIGGNMLLNSGTPTITLIISYGGTTMFSDVTGAATADTDRLAWFLDFQINAQANNDQALVGHLQLSPVAAKTAPTAGLGDIALTAANNTPFAGSAAVDSDAADRTLTVTWTMNVSNSANEIVTEFASVELL